MAIYYGNTESTSSGNSSFRIVCEYTASNQGNGYYQYKYRFYVQVTKGNFYGTNLSTSWGSNVTIRGAGKYGYSGYKTKNVAYGSKFTLGTTAYAQYTSSSTYRSQISGSAAIASVPRPKYTVAYNANGGSGAPSKQTKTYGVTLKLSSSKPTRTGYSFQGWGTTSSDTSVNYAAGASYTSNSSITLYAIWKANTYAVIYNANGGSGAPSNQTKTYGQNLTLSSTIPVLENYNFLGWGTSSSSTTVAYSPGDTYLSNSAITLYAIWELAHIAPIITNFTVDRCTSDGTISDDGTYVKIMFEFKTETALTAESVTVEWKKESDEEYTNSDPAVGNITGTGMGVVRIIGDGEFDTEYAYIIRLTIDDGIMTTQETRSISSLAYEIDVLAGGGGVAIGRPAYRKGLDIAMNTYFNNDVALLNNIWLKAQLSSGDYASLMRVNENGQVELDWTSGGLKGRIMKELWTGTWSSGSITVPDLPYYNMLLLRASEMAGTSILAIREINGATIFRGGTLYAYEASTGANAMYISGFWAHTTGATGTTLTMDKTHMWSIYSNTSSVANSKNLTITKIVGVI